ncbi:MAG: hypothetical protein ACRC28_03955, partial [Clostridium sp.]
PFIQTTKAVDLAAAKKGDVLVYTIGVSNTGTNMANTVRLLDTLPTGLSFKSGSVMLDGVSYPSATVLPPLGFLIGDMPIDSYHTVTFNVDVIAKATAFTNTGTISYKYSTTASTIPDYLAFKDTNDVVTTFIDSPNFTISKVVDRNFAISTDTISYTLVIKNTGTLASDAILFDTLPSGLTFIPNSIKVNNLPISGDITPPGITLTSIAINEVRTVTFNASINSSTTVFTNTGYIYSTIPDLTNVESNIVTTTLVNPSVSSIKFVDKTFATLNDTITYTISINNTGNVDLKNVFFLDTINLGATFIPNSVQVNSVPVSSVSVVPPGFLALTSLPAGTTSTISFLAKVNSSVTISNIENSGTFTSSYTIDGTTTPTRTGTISTNTNIVSTTISYTTPVITKSVDKLFSTTGNTLTYSLSIFNNGNIPMTNLIITDTLANSLNFVLGSVTIDGVSSPSDSITSGILISSLSPLQTTTITFNATIL